jgi:hypothetical protein
LPIGALEIEQTDAGKRTAAVKSAARTHAVRVSRVTMRLLIAQRSL